MKLLDFFLSALIAYRVLLLIPVKVVSMKKRILKLNLLKSYLRSTMFREIFNRLMMIVIENDRLEGMNYKYMIENFAFKIVRRVV